MRKTCCLTDLTDVQIQSLNHLIASCQKAEPLHLGFPQDASRFFMVCENETILSCLIVCEVQKDLWECYAFTRPDCRREGLFSELLDTLCQTVPDETELVFLLDHQSPDALAAFSALEMDLWRSEYQMECILSPNRQKQNRFPAFSSSSLSLCKKELQDENCRGWIFTVFHTEFHTENPSVSSSNPVGSCRVLAYDATRFYLYQVNIHEGMRRQGLGTWLIEAVMNTLPQNAQIYLQVAADNKAAVQLYQKTGFRITETLSYYLY